MTENKRFTQKDEDDWEILDRNKHFAYAHSGYQAEKIIQELNELVETNRELYKENKELKGGNEQLKSELRRIYDVATINKTREIVDSIYDELLYETSEESEHKRNIILKCLEKLDDFRDDME